jgi:hypothetical protein
LRNIVSWNHADVDACRRGRQAFAAALLVFLSGPACVGPARTFETYEGKAVAAAEETVSALRTATLGARVAVEGRSFPPTTSVLLADAERDAIGARGSFASIQPPDGASDRLRDELIAMLDDAVDRLARLRIAARRTDLEDLARLADPLPDQADQLEDFAEDLVS